MRSENLENELLKSLFHFSALTSSLLLLIRSTLQPTVFKSSFLLLCVFLKADLLPLLYKPRAARGATEPPELYL